MSRCQRFIFLLALGVYLLNRYGLPRLNLVAYKIPYLNDVLCLPVVLPVAWWLQQKLFPQSARPRLNGAQVFFTWLYFSIFFEGILPAYSEKFTRDYWDILAYAIGAIFYYLFLNPKASSGIKPDKPILKSKLG